MNFDYSGEQRLFKDEARKFLAAQSRPAAIRAVLDDNDVAYDKPVGGVAAQGWMGAAIPETYGGLGLGHFELSAIAEELGRAGAPIPFASTVYLSAEATMLFGSEAQKARWLPGIADGSVICGMTASEGPGSVTWRSVGAQVRGGVLNGNKLPVTDGDIADLIFADAPAARLGSEAGIAAMRAVFDRAAVLIAFEQLGGRPLLGNGTRLRARSVCLRAADRRLSGNQAQAGRYVCPQRGCPVERLLRRLGAECRRGRTAARRRDRAGRRVRGILVRVQGKHPDARRHRVHLGADPHLFYCRARQLALVVGSPAVWRVRLVEQLETRNAA